MATSVNSIEYNGYTYQVNDIITINTESLAYSIDSTTAQSVISGATNWQWKITNLYIADSVSTPNYPVVIEYYSGDSGYGNGTIKLENIASGGTPISYIISFNANGGENAPNAITKYHAVDITLPSAIPTRHGYNFVGWSNTQTGNKLWDASGNFNWNLTCTLYALWTPWIHTVAYHHNGGDNAPESQKKVYGQSLTLTSSIPTKHGYNFVGWGLSESDTTVDYLASGDYSYDQDGGTRTLFAIWTPKMFTNKIIHWLLGFQNQEGNNESGSRYKLGETTFEVPYESTYIMDESKGVTIPNGCYLSKIGSITISDIWEEYEIGSSFIQKDDGESFEYLYYPIEYNVEYELDNSLNSTDNPSHYNVLYGLTLKDPYKIGYNFLGWYVDDNNITGINDGVDASFQDLDDLYNQLDLRTTGDITFVAKFEPANVINGKIDNEYKLCNVHFKLDNIWVKAIMFNKIDNNWERSIV